MDLTPPNEESLSEEYINNEVSQIFKVGKQLFSELESLYWKVPRDEKRYQEYFRSDDHDPDKEHLVSEEEFVYNKDGVVIKMKKVVQVGGNWKYTYSLSLTSDSDDSEGKRSRIASVFFEETNTSPTISSFNLESGLNTIPIDPNTARYAWEAKYMLNDKGSMEVGERINGNLSPKRTTTASKAELNTLGGTLQSMRGTLASVAKEYESETGITSKESQTT